MSVENKIEEAVAAAAREFAVAVLRIIKDASVSELAGLSEEGVRSIDESVDSRASSPEQTHAPEVQVPGLTGQKADTQTSVNEASPGQGNGLTDSALIEVKRLDERDQRVIEYLGEHPGSTSSEIALSLSIPLREMGRRLEILEGVDVLATDMAESGAMLYWFTEDMPEERRTQNITTVRRGRYERSVDRTTNAIVDYLETCPGVSAKHISMKLGIAETTVSRRLRQLQRTGAVASVAADSASGSVYELIAHQR